MVAEILLFTMGDVSSTRPRYAICCWYHDDHQALSEPFRIQAGMKTFPSLLGSHLLSPTLKK